MAQYYIITNLMPGKGGRRKPTSFTGDLIAEYGHFFLFRGKNGYRFTIGKNELHCGHYSMEKVGGGAK